MGDTKTPQFSGGKGQGATFDNKTAGDYATKPGINDPGGFGDMLGINPKQGDYATPQFNWEAINRGDQQQMKSAGDVGTLAGTAQARQAGVEQANPFIQNYAMGVDNLGQTMQNIQGFNPEGVSGDRRDAARQAMMNELATGATTGSKFATEQVQNNPILGQLFGQGGALERTNQQEKDLSSRGYSLQPEDYEAYGQASGNLARMFGQQEQNLSQSLADRGLSQAPSGAAGAGFSGLMGNKNEQLGQLQTQIAQQRMQSNMQRLADTRNFMSQLGAQGANDIQQQYGRQLAGAQQEEANRTGTQASTANAANVYGQAGQQAFQQGMGAFGANLASQQQKTEAYQPGLMEMFGTGLKGSAYNIGSSPGTGSQSASSSFGSLLGKGMAG